MRKMINEEKYKVLREKAERLKDKMLQDRTSQQDYKVLWSDKK